MYPSTKCYVPYSPLQSDQIIHPKLSWKNNKKHSHNVTAQAHGFKNQMALDDASKNHQHTCNRPWWSKSSSFIICRYLSYMLFNIFCWIPCHPYSSFFILFPSLSFLVYLLCTMFKSIDFKKNALHYKNPWKRSLGSIYLQNVLLDPILSLITKSRAQGFGKCTTSSTRNYDIRFPLYKKVCVRNVPHKKLGLLEKGVFCNGLEALHLVEDIQRGIHFYNLEKLKGHLFLLYRKQYFSIFFVIIAVEPLRSCFFEKCAVFTASMAEGMCNWFLNRTGHCGSAPF